MPIWVRPPIWIISITAITRASSGSRPPAPIPTSPTRRRRGRHLCRRGGGRDDQLDRRDQRTVRRRHDGRHALFRRPPHPMPSTRTNYAASGDAYQASTAGVSAGKAQNNVNSTTTAEIGTHLIINSAGGDMVSSPTTSSIRAAAARVRAQAARSRVLPRSATRHVTQTVTTNIGAGTVLSLNGDPRTWRRSSISTPTTR